MELGIKDAATLRSSSVFKIPMIVTRFQGRKSHRVSFQDEENLASQCTYASMEQQADLSGSGEIIETQV